MNNEVIVCVCARVCVWLCDEKLGRFELLKLKTKVEYNLLRNIVLKERTVCVKINDSLLRQKGEISNGKIYSEVPSLHTIRCDHPN